MYVCMLYICMYICAHLVNCEHFMVANVCIESFNKTY